jgi:hypothetical protein
MALTSTSKPTSMADRREIRIRQPPRTRGEFEAGKDTPQTVDTS